MARGQVAKQHSNEQRKILVNLVYNCRKSLKEAAQFLGIKYKTASRICNQFDKTGVIEKKKRTGERKVFGTPIKRRIVGFFNQKMDATLAELSW